MPKEYSVLEERRPFTNSFVFSGDARKEFEQIATFLGSNYGPGDNLRKINGEPAPQSKKDFYYIGGGLVFLFEREKTSEIKVIHDTISGIEKIARSIGLPHCTVEIYGTEIISICHVK